VVWTGGGGFKLAPAILTLLQQLQQAYPGTGWLTSPQTGTIGDVKHQATNSGSDHNPWLNNTVRALDVAANVSGVAGIVTVTDAPDCEALFAMVNRMYAAKDPRVWPNGYAIFKARITDWNNPGGVKPYNGKDQHFYHLHVSVSQNPAGYNSTAPWPLPGESALSIIETPIGEDMPLTEDEWKRLQNMMQTMVDGAVQRVHDDLTGTMTRIKAYEAEIVGLRDYIRGTACAISGQLPALPDGTTITSISLAHAEELSAIAKVQAQISGSAGIDQNVRGGDVAVGGPDGGQPVAQPS
jgi:hypothetical protein